MIILIVFLFATRIVIVVENEIEKNSSWKTTPQSMLVWDLCAGHPRRHLLTTGWSVFVSSKRLVAGDSVLFLR